MDGFASNPIISFERDNKVVALGRYATDDVIHLSGSTGLGLPPASIAQADRVAGDGSIVRGVRYDAREVFIPFGVWKETKAEATQLRRSFYRHFAPHLGPVTIRVEDPPTGTIRCIDGYLKEGLEGDFVEDFNGVYQTFGLTFMCPDPWWRGEDQLVSFRVASSSKPFLSDTTPFFPIVLSDSNVSGKYRAEISGDGAVSPIWQVTGPGTDLTISNGKDTFMMKHTLKPGEKLLIDSEKQILEPDLWEKVPLTSKLFKLHPGVNELSITMVGATSESIVRLIYSEKYLEAL